MGPATLFLNNVLRNTALHWAVRDGHIEAVDWLIENGCDIIGALLPTPLLLLLLPSVLVVVNGFPP